MQFIHTGSLGIYEFIFCCDQNDKRSLLILLLVMVSIVVTLVLEPRAKFIVSFLQTKMDT